MFNSEEPPRAKKRKEEEEEGGSLESCLTDDLLLNCVARLSRPELAALSLASKSYRSLVGSPDLYKIRSLIGRTETYVYVCIRTPGPDSAIPWYIPRLNPTLGWYILRRGKTSSDLIPILSPSLPLEGSSVVVLDCGIYVIGGFINGEEQEQRRSSDVWLLDCRTHTWRTVPSMGVGRAYGAAGVVGGKIYVLGGYDVVDDGNWGQVFDPKTQTWDTLPPPMPKGKIVNNLNIHDCFVRDHKVYAVDGMDRTYNYYSPREVKWGTGNRDQQIRCRRDWCMIDNLIYCLNSNGSINWCEPDELDLRGEKEEIMINTKEVKGLGSSLKVSLFLSSLVHVGDQILHRWEQTKIKNGHPPPNKKSKFAAIRELEVLIPGARLINSGGNGNMVLFWDRYGTDGLEIWCAEISLERRQGEGGGGDEIWGKTEWSSVVMTYKPWPNHYKFYISPRFANLRKGTRGGDDMPLGFEHL